MRTAKSCQFSQVRILVEGDAGLMQRTRPAMQMPRTRLPAISTSSRHDVQEPVSQDSPAPAGGPGKPEAAGEPLSRLLPVSETDQDEGRQEEWPAVQPDEPPEPDDVPSATAGPASSELAPPMESAAPRRLTSDDAMAAVAAAAVAGISRSMQDTMVIRSLVGWLVQTCGEPSYRASGPWEFNLSLDRFGAIDADLHLRLSSELLSLRFQCRSRNTRALLSRHQNTLQAMLREQLHPPIDIEIDVDMSHG